MTHVSTWTLATLLVIAFISSALVAAPFAAPKNGASAAEDYDSIQQHLTEYRGDPTEENYERVTGATERFLADHPNDQRWRQVVLLHMQLMHIHEDWQGLLEYSQENLDAFEEDEELWVTLLGNQGIAHANLHNQKEAEEVVEQLRRVETANRRVFAQAQRTAEEIERILRFLPGNPAPEFSLPRVDGDGEVSLEDLSGRYALLVFNWAQCSDCRHLKDQVLEPMWRAYQDETFEIVSIGIDSAELQRQALEEHGYDWTMIYDPEHDIVSDYGVRGVPFLALIDPEGKFVAVGTREQALGTIRESLADAFPDIEVPEPSEPDDEDEAANAEENDTTE